MQHQMRERFCQMNFAMKFEIQDQLLQCPFINSDGTGLIEMPRGLDAVVANVTPLVKEGKRCTTLPALRGMNRLEVPGTGRAQKPVHHKPESRLDADIVSVICFSGFRPDEHLAVEAPAGKDGFGKGFDDPKQVLSLHPADHGIRKTGT
jgi:hypothetical protein